MKRTLISIGVVVLAGVTPTPTGEFKTLKIGFLMPLSGAGSAWGRQFEEGFDWSVDKINNAGGVKIGSDIYMIKGIKGDSKMLGSAAATEVTRMIFEDNVHYVVGPIITHHAIMPITEANKCFIADSGTDLPVGADHPWNIQTALPSEFWYKAFWDQAYADPDIDIKTVVILSPDANQYDNTTGICEAIHLAHGSEVLMVKRYTQFATDFYPILTPVVAKNPDAIDFDGGTHGDIDLMVKQIRELGYKGRLFGPAYGDPASAIEIAGAEAAEGFTVNDPDYTSTLYPESTRQLAAEFEQRYPGSPLALTTYIAYSAVQLYAQAIEAAGSIDPDEVRKALDDPNFTYEAFGMPGMKLGGQETYGIPCVMQGEVGYSQVINGVKVMLSRKTPDIP